MRNEGRVRVPKQQRISSFPRCWGQGVRCTNGGRYSTWCGANFCAFCRNRHLFVVLASSLFFYQVIICQQKEAQTIFNDCIFLASVATEEEIAVLLLIFGVTNDRQVDMWLERSLQQIDVTLEELRLSIGLETDREELIEMLGYERAYLISCYKQK